MNKLWMCPRCRSILEKRDGIATAVFNAGGALQGAATCGKCGARYNLQDVYEGKYDLPSDERYDLVIVACDAEPEDRNTFLPMLFERFHVPICERVPCIVYRDSGARSFDDIFQQVMTIGQLNLKRASLEWDDDGIRWLPFVLTQGKTEIGGNFIMIRGKRI